ncbi:MAG TPA: hypothetical protein VM101_14865 [Flavitalea sp.]|nr:hypothetical protein [Flavitalea sp.]
MRFIYILFVFITACRLGGGYEKAENAQDAGREFIRATLEGDHQKARFYLLQDTTNLLLIEKQQQNYQHLSMEEKRQHRESNIRPITIKKINDSTTSYQYYTTYNQKDTTTIKIVKENGDWLVDLKSILTR